MDFAYTPAQQELKARAAAYAELLMGYEDEAEQAGGPLPEETVDKLTRAAMDAGVYGINMPRRVGRRRAHPARAGDRRGGVRQGHQLPVGHPVAAGERARLGVYRAAGALPAADPARRAVRRVRDHRARRRLRRRRDGTTTATPVDGGWLINGEKWFVTCGDVADFLLVQANVLPGNENTLFFVEKDTPGVRISRTPHFMHSAVNGHPEFVFENVFVADRRRARRGRAGLRTDQGLVHRRAADDRRAHRRRRRTRAAAGPGLGDPAQAVRGADQRLPDDPGDAGRLRRRHRGEPVLHPPGRVGGRQRRRTERRCTPRPPSRSCPPARPPAGWSTGACRSSAAAATTGRTRSSGCTARCGSTASGKAPRRSSGSSSPTS